MKGTNFYIVVYDVEQKRIAKFLKLLRRYLHWVQNSVFEGELSEGQFASLKQELKSLANKETDSVIIYCMREKWLNRELIGVEKGTTNVIL